MKAHRAMFTLAAMCRVLGLSTSGYNDWLKRPLSVRAQRDNALKDKIMEIWNESGGIYGYPRIHAALRAAGEPEARGTPDAGAGHRGRDAQAFQDRHNA